MHYIEFSYKFFNPFLFHAYKNPAVLSGGIKIFNFQHLMTTSLGKNSGRYAL